MDLYFPHEVGNIVKDDISDFAVPEVVTDAGKGKKRAKSGKRASSAKSAKGKGKK